MYFILLDNLTVFKVNDAFDLSYSVPEEVKLIEEKISFRQVNNLVDLLLFPSIENS